MTPLLEYAPPSPPQKKKMDKHYGYFYIEGEEKPPLKKLMSYRLYKGDIVEFPATRFVIRTVVWHFYGPMFSYYLEEI